MDSNEPMELPAGGYYTVAEAARFLGVGRRVIYQLIECGRIRSARMRHALLVEVASLEEFRRSGELT